MLTRRIRRSGIAALAVAACAAAHLTVHAPALADGPTVTPGVGGGAEIAVSGSTGGGGASSGGGAPGAPQAPAAGGGGGGGGGFVEIELTPQQMSEAVDGCVAADLFNGCLAPAPGQGPVPATPSMVDVATALQVAVTAANIQPIQIGITPEDLPGRTGLVGNPTWLWVKNPSESTIGPVQRTVTTGAVTVNLTGVLTSIVWNMGDGLGVVPCAGPPVAPYTPYIDAMQNLPSPTCGYYYQRSSIDQPGGVWQVSATSMWLIFWSVATPQGGMGGVIPLAPTARTQIRTGELQVLVQPVP